MVGLGGCVHAVFTRVLQRMKTLRDIKTLEIFFLALRIFSTGSLGVVGKCGWFALKASGVAELIAIVYL
jgi:hypothetical protein